MATSHILYQIAFKPETEQSINITQFKEELFTKEMIARVEVRCRVSITWGFQKKELLLYLGLME